MLSKPLLEGRLTIADHVEDHGQSAEEVDDKQGYNGVAEYIAVCQPEYVEEFPIVHRSHKHRHLAGDAAGIKNNKEQVPHPEQWVRSDLGRVAAEYREDIEQVLRHTLPRVTTTKA